MCYILIVMQEEVHCYSYWILCKEGTTVTSFSKILFVYLPFHCHSHASKTKTRIKIWKYFTPVRMFFFIERVIDDRI